MIVGHAKDWRTTNAQRSQWYLFIGGVRLFQLSGMRFVRRQIYANPIYDTIQNRAYDCLTGMHMRGEGEGLTWFNNYTASCVNGNKPEFLLSYFVNYMMHHCAIATPQGTTPRDVIKRCMYTHIITRINSACPDVGDGSRSNANLRNAKPRNVKIAWLCSRWAADTAQYIGLPQASERHWREYSNRWQEYQHIVARGVVPGLRRTPLAQWNDHNAPNRHLLHCKGNYDLKLLCSDPTEDRVIRATVDHWAQQHGYKP